MKDRAFGSVWFGSVWFGSVWFALMVYPFLYV